MKNSYTFVGNDCFIALRQDKITVINKADFHLISKFIWYADNKGHTHYVRAKEKGKTIYMHRILMKTPKGKVVDHKNHNGLDNRRTNLRNVTRRQNLYNTRGNRKATSVYKGVSWDAERNKWLACIQHEGKVYKLGRFYDEDDAAMEYNKNAVFYFGPTAYLNIIR